MGPGRLYVYAPACTAVHTHTHPWACLPACLPAQKYLRLLNSGKLASKEKHAARIGELACRPWLLSCQQGCAHNRLASAHQLSAQHALHLLTHLLHALPALQATACARSGQARSPATTSSSR